MLGEECQRSETLTVAEPTAGVCARRSVIQRLASTVAPVPSASAAALSAATTATGSRSVMVVVPVAAVPSSAAHCAVSSPGGRAKTV